VTTLADLQPGDEFLFACQVTSLDPTAGLGLALYGPGRVEAATAVIAPTGVMTGQLAAAPAQVPVTVITGFAPVTVGDILVNDATGETMLCRWSQIGPDGTVTWAAAPGHQVIYPARGWTVAGHADGF
jgi:hypothetical protein